MFTKYPDLFIIVKKRLKNNQAVANLLPFFRKKEKLKDIELLIDQCVFEVLSELKNKDLLKDYKNNKIDYKIYEIFNCNCGTTKRKHTIRPSKDKEISHRGK